MSISYSSIFNRSDVSPFLFLILTFAMTLAGCGGGNVEVEIETEPEFTPQEIAKIQEKINTALIIVLVLV